MDQWGKHYRDNIKTPECLQQQRTKKARNKVRMLFPHNAFRTLTASVSCHVVVAISLGEDICAETIPANGIIMGLDPSPASPEDVWMADVAEVAEVLLAEEAGEVLNDLTFPPEV